MTLAHGAHSHAQFGVNFKLSLPLSGLVLSPGPASDSVECNPEAQKAPGGCVVSKSSIASGNRLYFGDNLDILREYVAAESVDLIYLDPPFNSQAQYNVLFRSPQEDSATAQAQAFLDTWTWGEEAEWAFKEVMKNGGSTARFIDALRSALKESDMMAYLVMMAVRLSEIRRVLKDTGNIFLHCDLTAKHYLKVMMDGIFEPQNFRNEITRARTTAGKPVTKNLPKNADYILWYAKSPEAKFYPITAPLTDEDLETFTKDDDDGRGPYNTQPIINPAF